MENIKDVIAKNLIKLRKQNKLTQAELSEKLNYSDKAVSRWESGEVTPDIETLNNIAEIYNVGITSLFNQNLDVEAEKKINKREANNRTAIILLAISFVWILATLVFIYSNIISGYVFWKIFVYSVPATFLVAIIFIFVWKIRKWRFRCISAFFWTLLASFYVVFLDYNIWLVFLLGAPIQIAIVLWSRIKFRK